MTVDNPTVLDEKIAIVATRAEWAGILGVLGESRRYQEQLQENPDTMEAADSQAIPPDNVLDAIAVTVVGTQLRLERNVPPCLTTVRVLHASRRVRPAWEPSE